MESLGEILQRLQRMSQEGVKEFPPELLEELDPEPETVCPACNNQGWVRRNLPATHQDFGKAFPCSVCGGQKDARSREMKRQQLPESQREYTFASLNTNRPELDPEQANRYAEVVRWCHSYASGEVEQPWLLMTGNPGWGKTHLAVCICNWRLDHPEKNLPPAVFGNVPEVFADLREGIRDENFESVMQGYQDCPLLVLDDLGKENPTAWAKEQLYRMLNFRYVRRMPTVVTTNIDIRNLDSALADRLVDENTGLVKKFALDLPSYRSGKVW